jgi:hypothetical protein
MKGRERLLKCSLAMFSYLEVIKKNEGKRERERKQERGRLWMEL